MPENKQDSFTVTDRRLFTPEGELRQGVSEEEIATSQAAPQAVPPAQPAAAQGPESSVPPPPTAAEQKEQADAYHKSSLAMDARVELSGHSVKDMEMTFERFLASLYMTAMLQLGLMQEQGGQPRIDLVGARQTIDTISLLAEKTKGNLTPAEEHFLQNCLYELRMAYVEVTNALTRPPQATSANSVSR
jgi:hypothetical protein